LSPISGDEEGHERAYEHAAPRYGHAVLTQLVRLQCPERHDDHADTDDHVQHDPVEEPAEPRAYEPRRQMVGEGGR
jgi:hypothetical protein